MMFVYIVRCFDGSYYTGVTNNLEKRISEHNAGSNPKHYTYKRRPFMLLFSQMFSDPREAIAAEKQIKGWRREKKEALINKDYEILTKLAKTSSNQ